MFERFTKDARAVVVRAQAEARGLKHPTIGNEHLLLALAELPGPVRELLCAAGVEAAGVRAQIEGRVSRSSSIIDERDAEALRSVGIDPDAVLAKIEESFGPEAVIRPRTTRRGWFGRRAPSGRFSPRAKKTLELALREAIRLKDRQIGAGHLMLGLLRGGEGLGALILAELLARSGAGVDFGHLRTQVESGLRRAA